MLIAALNEGDEVIVPRCAHRSLQAGLVFSGAVPHYASSPYDKETGVSLAVELSEMEKLQQKYPNVKAWAVTAATPYGSCADIKSISEAAHKCGIPMLVDEAWGPHFGAADGLPQSSVSQGADCCVQSAHKLLGALSQASFLHCQGSLIDRTRLNLTLRMLQSTSPSYLLLASLDLARRQLALEGERLWTCALKTADELRDYVRALPGFSVMEQGASYDYDRTRVVISAIDLGIDGVELERTLRYRFKVQPEMSDIRNVVLVITPSQTEEDLERLRKALKDISDAPHDWLAREGIKVPLNLAAELEFPGFPELVLTPREAYFSKSEAVSWDKACGRICAELITPYPPGIPMICPGERIKKEHLEYLQNLYKAGIPIDGAHSKDLKFIKVIK